jgi:histidine triad (HIT) family protein
MSRKVEAGGPRCAFCAIATGEAEAHRVLAGSDVVAFLDRRPLFPGHVLLIPRAHVPTLGDLPASLLEPLFGQAQRLARAVECAVGADGTFVAINNRVSQSVPHLHVHIVPRRRGDGLKGFFWPRRGYRDDAHAAQVCAAIRRALDGDEG